MKIYDAMVTKDLAGQYIRVSVNLALYEWVSETFADAMPLAAFEPVDREKYGNFCDITLIVGEEKINCHKFQLARRSEVFEAMFNHNDTKENQVNEVEIKDFNAETVKDFVDFLYNGEPEDKGRCYDLDLLALADKYNVGILKTACEKELISKLDKSNVVGMWIGSDLYQAEDLYKAALDYLVNNWDIIEELEGYKSLSEKPELLMKLIKEMKN